MHSSPTGYVTKPSFQGPDSRHEVAHDPLRQLDNRCPSRRKAYESDLVDALAATSAPRRSAHSPASPATRRPSRASHRAAPTPPRAPAATASTPCCRAPRAGASAAPRRSRRGRPGSSSSTQGRSGGPPPVPSPGPGRGSCRARRDGERRSPAGRRRRSPPALPDRPAKARRSRVAADHHTVCSLAGEPEHAWPARGDIDRDRPVTELQPVPDRWCSIPSRRRSPL